MLLLNCNDWMQWIYHSDDWLLVRRWEYILSRRSQIDIVQLLSWNGAFFVPISRTWLMCCCPADGNVDYGESHYMGPIHGSQPNSQAWVDGFPHTAWLTLNKHFIDAFKNSQRGRGNMPQVTEDKIWVWGRPHKRDSDARTDTVGRPTGWELVRYSNIPLSALDDVNSTRRRICSGLSFLRRPHRMSPFGHYQIQEDHIG